ncbi:MULTISPECIES: APC family permease [Brevibacterium]|uniref:APC family permease n=1 Tax=Brevibacterium TaxID=1696 RepID=UPI000DE88D84|nr:MULTISPECIES: APC family permease [Brevibacterium]
MNVGILEHGVRYDTGRQRWPRLEWTYDRRTRFVLRHAPDAPTRTPAPRTDHSAPPARIGLLQGTALYTCAILGAGVLVLPGQVASQAGPASLVAWTLSAVLGIPLAFTFAALAARMPDAGGVATYAARAFGPTAGAIAGWWYFIAVAVGQTVVPLTAGHYLCAALDLSGHWAPVFGILILGVTVWANLAGVAVGARLQIGLALGVAGILLTVIVVAVPQVSGAAFTPFAPTGIAGIGQAVVVLFFAFAGWEAVAHLSAEFRDVRRTLPRATLLTVLIVTVLYLGVATAVVGTGPTGIPEPTGSPWGSSSKADGVWPPRGPSPSPPSSSAWARPTPSSTRSPGSDRRWAVTAGRPGRWPMRTPSRFPWSRCSPSGASGRWDTWDRSSSDGRPSTSS